MNKKKTDVVTLKPTELPSEKLKELKDTANEILAYCRQQMLNKHPFIGNVAMSMELKAVRDIRCSTALTDGSSIFVDIDFLSRLGQAEREFVIGHEVWHNVMLHFTRGEGRKMTLFNIATDMEVNQLLEKDGFVAPKDVIFPNKSHGRAAEFNFPDDLSAEEYYDLLLKEMKDKGLPDDYGGDDAEGEGSSSGSGASSGGRSGNKKSKGKGSCSGQFDEHYDKNKDYSEEKFKDMGIADKYGIKGFDDDFTIKNGMTEAEERAAADRIRESVVGSAQMVERTRGSLPGHVKKIVDALLDPKLPWKELLAKFITTSLYNKTNWNRPNRRFAYTSTYLPSHMGETVKIAIGIDTSGSCAQDVEKFATEVNAIVTTFGSYELHVIQCDTEVKNYDVYDEANPFDIVSKPIEFKGFGGTELHPVFDFIKDKDIDVDAVVFFTDGECEVFDESSGIELPVLWVLTGTKDKKTNLKIGEQVILEQD